MEGKVAHDAHLFANAQWAFVRQKKRTISGYVEDKIPDALPSFLPHRTTISNFPSKKAPTFPTQYSRRLVPKHTPLQGRVPVITMGRYGNLVFRKRASDDAFNALIGSAKKTINFAIQDLGPICIPQTKLTVPGYKWPTKYMNAIARALWTKAVNVNILLSNPHSIPGGLTALEANYGNGWTCVDVAAEIIKRVKKQFKKVDDADLRNIVSNNLKVSFIRNRAGNRWDDGGSLGMHAKHFIIDDICCYIGSQNLYECDLAEWGIVIDDQAQTQKIMDEYWNPMWRACYNPDDCNVQEVMDNLKVDRRGQNSYFASPEKRKEFRKAQQTQFGVLHEEEKDHYHKEKELDFHFDFTKNVHANFPTMQFSQWSKGADTRKSITTSTPNVSSEKKEVDTGKNVASSAPN
mmetsp:Transcript_15715/g.21014  ORF Transcript_15715/g.21014 Transcript_15715/m.21014 type:complete len:405 (+) Transcript_15715:6-1220(+)